MSLLSVNDLVVRYGAREVVHGVSFHVDPGEAVTLIGSNGVGKTTTLKAVTGVVRGRAGSRIEFDGTRIDAMAPHEILRAGLALVPEGRQLFADMTVLEHLEIGGRVAQPGAAGIGDRFDEMYDLFPVLKERRKQKAGTLSGGQQQMLAIARGLMSCPKCLMLDEPSLGLAPVVIDSLADILAALHANGLAIVIVEQRVDLALKIADRGYVMESGVISLEGTSDALLGNPRVQKAYLGL
jgi:branched-chain amino acid transport system ATP-binding protein